MDWNLLFQSYYQFGWMFLLLSIGMGMVIAMIDSLPVNVLRPAEQH